MKTSFRRAAVVAAAASVVYLCGSATVLAEPVRMPAGMSIELELLHHVNSGYTPTGTPIHFRVVRDVIIGGQVLVVQGAPVVGRMDQATERGMVGKSGSMSLEVDTVPAVDGTRIPVHADVDKQGRSRAGATVAWTLVWGLPGLVTRGVNPYIEKGATLLATVRSEVTIDPDNAQPAAPLELGTLARIERHQWSGDRPNSVKSFDLERKKTIKPVSFTVALPAELTDTVASLRSLELVMVDGVPLPERPAAMSVDKNAASFEGWSVLRYCRDGANTLTFAGRDPSGQRFHANYVLNVKVKKKG